jgi:hypothetical protein
MTAYFDHANAEIREASERAGGDALAFLDALMAIEKRVIKDVQLNTGDREFPEDLREVILGSIATEACTGALPDDSFYEEARAVAIAGRCSTVIDSLHGHFHTLARRRLDARFGRWSDDPGGNLRLRDAHDRERYGPPAEPRAFLPEPLERAPVPCQLCLDPKCEGH